MYDGELSTDTGKDCYWEDSECTAVITLIIPFFENIVLFCFSPFFLLFFVSPLGLRITDPHGDQEMECTIDIAQIKE